MKTILCYGDSNTWGFDPKTGWRYPMDVRWPSVMRKELGAEYWVVEEGLCGRTTVWDDPIEGDRNGKKHLASNLESHCPLDLVTIMLGTNDLKTRFSLSAHDIARGAAVLVRMVQGAVYRAKDAPPKVLLIAPPVVAEKCNTYEAWLNSFDKSSKFGSYYAAVAKECGCGFLDAGQVVKSSQVDGVHLDAGEHAKLGLAVTNKVREMLGC
ncbi:MAG: SGNH/GDSL hydrolase family protein [Phycisphaeraceae bacterium]|nr:SGNH/GDSL hydrolase family protein [Phycisphaeraceae bacterium]